VKTKLNAGSGNQLTDTGSAKYSHLKSNGSWFWDQDGGIKTDACHTFHIRVYAPYPADRMGAPPSGVPGGWGWVVIGSNHRDHADAQWSGCDVTHYDESEAAEHQFAGWYSNVALGWVFEDSYFAANLKYGWDAIEGSNHVWSNDGYATVARVF
jgi:hypothetical protein